MRVLLIGGTGFTGPALVGQLHRREHEVICLHRGHTHDVRTKAAREIILDRHDEARLAAAVVEASPDVVVDMIAFTGDEAVATVKACKNVVPRIVALSSIDVYLAYGRIHRTEPGPPQPTPLTEASALRETNQPEGPERDKLAVESCFLDDNHLPATILRLPAVFGERDKHRRLRSYLKRMDDGREVIPLGESIASWKFSRGYTGNVAHAIVLAIESGHAADEVFNVGEERAMTELEFVRAIGEAAGWQGEVRVMPDAELPEHLQPTVNFAQDWEVDTRKIRMELGYSEIIPRQEAFRRTIDWERANPPDAEPYAPNYEQEDKALAT